MRCTNPISVKNGIVPCGQCMACRLNYGKEWSIRIMHELKKYDDAIFLTLTYDDEHLPKFGSLVPDDVTKFLKSLRQYLEPKQIRYFYAGEYGDKFGRPHYHLILFNVSNREGCFHLTQQKPGEFIGNCDFWKHGLIYIGKVTEDSACYVARYTTKKIKGKGAKKWYEEHNLVPEFARMSRRPGIGADFCDKFSDELIQHNSVISKGKEYGLPRYYKKRLDIKLDPEERCLKHYEKLQELEKVANAQGHIMVTGALTTEINKQRERTILSRMKG